MQTKILDIKEANWLDGISAQANIPLAGRFQALDNVDPFDLSGTAQPSLTPTTVTPSSVPKFLTPVNVSGTAYMYAHSDTKLTQILATSPYTQTDMTSYITVDTVQSAILWSSPTEGVLGYVYAASSSGLNFNAVPIVGASTKILNGFNSSSDIIPMCVGADRLLYVGQNSRIGIITRSNGTTGNTGQVFIDANLDVRAMVNDGQYLIILADNNVATSASRVQGDYRCRVYFWDMSKVDGAGFIVPDFVYDIIGESYLIGARILDGVTHIFGYNGLYTCSLGNPPKLIRSFVSSGSLTLAKPVHNYQIGISKGSIYWLDGGSNAVRRQNIYAYGNPITGHQKIFYTPYQNSLNGGYTNKCLAISGEHIWTGYDAPGVDVHNVGSTRGASSITSIQQTMPTTYRYEYTKVVLSQPLSSGQTVAVSVSTLSKTLSSETKSYSATNARQVLIFKRKVVGDENPLFDDFRIRVTATAGATILRVTTYATPLTDDSELI